MTKTKTSTNQLPTQKSNTLVDAQPGHHCDLWKHLRTAEKSKSKGCSSCPSACSATAAHLLPELTRGLVNHFSLTDINISLAEIKHSLQMAADQSALLKPTKLSLCCCWRVHISKLSTLPIKHWRETIFKHLFYILPLTGQVHWQANFMLEICSVKSERTRSKRPALSTGCNHPKDTINSLVVSRFPPSARLSYHSTAGFAPGQQECWQAAPVLQLRVQLIL